MFKPEKLEKILLVNWTEFLDKREILALAKRCAVEYMGIEPPCQVVTLTLSRFEIQDTGFLIWMEFTVTKSKNKIFGTSELHLSNTGNLRHLQTIRS